MRFLGPRDWAGRCWGYTAFSPSQLTFQRRKQTEKETGTCHRPTPQAQWERSAWATGDREGSGKGWGKPPRWGRYPSGQGRASPPGTSVCIWAASTSAPSAQQAEDAEALGNQAGAQEPGKGLGNQAGDGPRESEDSRLSYIYQASSKAGDKGAPTTVKWYSFMIWVPKSHWPGKGVGKSIFNNWQGQLMISLVREKKLVRNIKIDVLLFTFVRIYLKIVISYFLVS